MKDKTAPEVMKKLWTIFNEYSVPNKIRTGGAAAFTGVQFNDFCESLNMRHKVLSTYTSENNRVAEKH